MYVSPKLKKCATIFSLMFYLLAILFISIIYVVVVYQCSISNVMVTWDIEALLYSKVHAVLDCYKHTHNWPVKELFQAFYY